MSNKTEETYLENLIIFLKKVKWLFNFRNTDVFVNNALDNFPLEWKNYFSQLSVEDFHELLNFNVQDSAPLDFQLLIQEIKTLQPKIETFPIIPLDYNNSGICEKKYHEIGYLAPIINEIYIKNECNLIIDIGCGVGHLSQFLHTNYKYKILALDGSPQLIKTALKNLHPHSKNDVIFEEAFINESSTELISNLIKKHFNNDDDDIKIKACLIGLHACADLSVNILRIFKNLIIANAMIIMPCCYHRMNGKKIIIDEKESTVKFENFPISKNLKSLFEKYSADQFLRYEFMRLSCQQTIEHFKRMSQQEHERHSQHCVYRAILELVAYEENCIVKRSKRKSKKVLLNFQDYLNNLTHKFCKMNNDEEVVINNLKEKMYEKWSKLKNDCWHIEILMGLQITIQALCESVLLLDRVAFLKENGLHCYKKKITNDLLSPRCWAIISKKNTKLLLAK